MRGLVWWIVILFAVTGVFAGCGDDDSVQTFTVTYNGFASTGGGVPVDPGAYATGDTVTVLGNTNGLVRTGYTFAGWSFATNGPGILTPGMTFKMSNANVVLFARWTDLPTYTVTYDGNGQDSGSVPVDGVGYTNGQQVTVLSNTGGLAKTNGIFAGWTNAAGVLYCGGQNFTMGPAAVTLHAKWTPAYRVLYAGNGANGGSVPVDNTLYTNGQSASVLGKDTMTRTGYVFNGWTNANGPSYVAGQTIGITTANITLSAIWIAEGTPDTTFNTGTGANDTIHTIAVQPDGKILLGGAFTTFNGASHVRMVRLNADGTIDSSFNIGTGFNSSVGCIRLQPDGKILACGNFTNINGTIRRYIVRLESNGSIDSSFTIGTGFNATTTTILVQPDGKIVVTGGFSSFDGTSRPMIARLNSNGSLDTSFNPGTGFNNSCNHLSLLANGKILCSGSFITYNGTSRIRLARIETNGTLDTGFDPGTGPNNYLTENLVLPSGNILIGGNFTNYNGHSQKYLVRVQENGPVDATFNTGTGPNGPVHRFLLQADGKIVCIGEWSFQTYNGVTVNRVMRINPDGSLDTAFTTAAGTGAGNTVNAVAAQPGGMIIVGGSFTGFNGRTVNRIVRLWSN